MEWIFSAAAALLALAGLILLIVLLVRSHEKQVKSQFLDQEIRKMALDLPLLKQQVEYSYQEEKATSERISEQMQKLTAQNYEQLQRLSDSITRSLLAIRDRNDKESEETRALLEKNLTQIRATVDEKLTETLSARLDASFKTVSEQLENVYKSLGEMKELSTGVTENVSGLNRILTNVKLRGTWGELQLKQILDDIIPTMYDTNVATNPSKPQERVEFAVRIPTGDGSRSVYLPIDSKFPLEDYSRLIAANNEGDAEAANKARTALKNRVRAEAKSVNGYLYEPDTTPFAILYLATEGLYAEIANDETLLAQLRSKENVMIAGPSTIAALLNSLAMGFRTVAINRKAEEVRKLLMNIKTQYDKFEDLLARAKKKIDEAGSVLDDAQSRTQQIQKKLKNVESLEERPEPELPEA